MTRSIVRGSEVRAHLRTERQNASGPVDSVDIGEKGR